MYATEVPTGQGKRPQTTIRKANCLETTEGSCDLFEFNAGADIRISIRQLLSKLGVDLDRDACVQTGGQASNAVEDVCPTVRLIGMQLEFSVEYFNFEMQHGGGGISLSESQPAAIISVAPKLVWNSLGNDVRRIDNPTWAQGKTLSDPYETVNNYKYGITIVFKDGTGRIGKIDPFEFMNTILQVVVLLGVAKTVTTFVARFLMGAKSRTYNAAINEHMSFRRELSRFTCQALIANLSLRRVDEDGDKVITEKEMVDNMGCFYTKCLGINNTEACARACIDILQGHESEAGMARTTSGPKLARSMTSRAVATESHLAPKTVTIERLIDWMTDDRMDMDLMKDEIQKRVDAEEHV
jgi:hypothetical protein